MTPCGTRELLAQFDSLGEVLRRFRGSGKGFWTARRAGLTSKSPTAFMRTSRPWSNATCSAAPLIMTAAISLVTDQGARCLARGGDDVKLAMFERRRFLSPINTELPRRGEAIDPRHGPSTSPPLEVRRQALRSSAPPEGRARSPPGARTTGTALPLETPPVSRPAGLPHFILPHRGNHPQIMV